MEKDERGRRRREVMIGEWRKKRGEDKGRR